MLFKWLRELVNRILRIFKGEKEVFYINGPELLCPPLEPDKEAEIIEQLGINPEASRILIEHNLRLVVYIAKKSRHLLQHRELKSKNVEL